MSESRKHPEQSAYQKELNFRTRHYLYRIGWATLCAVNVVIVDLGLLHNTNPTSLLLNTAAAAGSAYGIIDETKTIRESNTRLEELGKP